MKGYGEKSKSKKKNNQKLQLTKEQIIIQAFKFHAQGNILEAAKYYQFFIDKGFKNHRVFLNHGVILKSLGELQSSELSFRKAIELNPNLA
uniref:tetratricopeptide repeat protein n=1 Tax=uncultured Prochlorococcus sp. TaxID=159733 RepID=UPI00258BC251